MARRIEINKPRSDSEDEAQRILARILPPSWIVTTNIKEHMFPGFRKPEIDCILITPLGVFVIDFKNYRGVVSPMVNQPWVVSQEDARNPLEQANDSVYPVKDLLRSFDEKLSDIWIEPLIVLTNESVELNWRSSDITDDNKMRIALLGEVEAKVRQIASTRKMSISADVASKVLKALKPVTLPTGLFTDANWAAEAASKPTASTKSTNPPPAVQKDRPSGTSSAIPTDIAQQYQSKPAPKFVRSELDAVLDKIFQHDWRNRGPFGDYLEQFGGSELLKRRANDPLSIAELEFLKRAKADFELRMSVANEICNMISSYDVDVIMKLSVNLSGLFGILSLERMTQIVRSYIRPMFLKEDGHVVETLVSAYRRLAHARLSDKLRRLEEKWKALCTKNDGLAGEIVLALAGNGSRLHDVRRRTIFHAPIIPGIPLWFRNDDNAQSVARSIIFGRLNPIRKAIDAYDMPWSSKNHARKLLNRMEAICRSDVNREMEAQLIVIADVFGNTLGKDSKLKPALVRESLTGDRFGY